MPPQYFYKSFCEAAGIPQEVMHLQGLTTFWPPIECISGQGKVCSQLLPWPGCREGQTHVLLHPQSPHIPSDCLEGAVLHTPALFRGSCLHMQTTKQELSNLFFSLKRWLLFSHHLFLWQHWGRHPKIWNKPHTQLTFFFPMTKFARHLYQQRELSVKMYQGWAFLVTCLRH